MGDAKTEFEFFKYPENILAEPGFIPELKSMTEGLGAGKGGKENAELLQPFFLELKLRRKLPEHSSHLLL